MWYQCNTVVKISIHALLAESDGLSYFYIIKITVFLSTLSLRRATANEALQKVKEVISIHALLAESDRRGASESIGTLHFYPRSPCGERHDTYAKVLRVNISIHALLAESDQQYQ